jgi:predicted ester cyclase
MEQTKSDSGGIPISDLRPEINRALAVRWFHEVWVERRTETIDELFPAGSIGHTENGDQGPAEFKAGREGLLNAFPDLQVEVEDTAADGDQVVVRWHAGGTHRGDGLGMPPTNRKVDFRGMTWLTFKNGVIVEGWDSWNLGRLLESLK